MSTRSLFLLDKIMREISDLAIENRGRSIRGARRSENAFHVVETTKKKNTCSRAYIYIRLGTYHISAPSMTRKRRRSFLASRFYSLRASIATITIKSILNEEEKKRISVNTIFLYIYTSTRNYIYINVLIILIYILCV